MKKLAIQIDEQELERRANAILKLAEQSKLPGWKGQAIQSIHNLRRSMEMEAIEERRKRRKTCPAI